MSATDPTVAAYISALSSPDTADLAIERALASEARYRAMFAQNPTDPELAPQKLSLINVYDDMPAEAWCARPRVGSEDADKIMFPLDKEKRLKPGVMAIPEKQEFIKNWTVFTQGSLATLNWNNVFVAGGSVLACLLPIPDSMKAQSPPYYNDHSQNEFYQHKAYPGSDIDLFIYGLDEEATKLKMIEIYRTICNTGITWGREILAVRSKNCVTIVSQYPYRHIQIVLRLYKSPAQTLMGFDVDSCCVGFDGTDVWCLPRAHHAIVTQCNTVDLTRRSPSYEMRLAKYSQRGFEVKVPGLRRDKIDPAIYEKNFEKLHGLARLLVMEKFNSPARCSYVESHRDRLRPSYKDAVLYSNWDERTNDLKMSQFINDDYETVYLPYGPQWTSAKLKWSLHKKDVIMNASWYFHNHIRTTHRHLYFFGSMGDCFKDLCGYCPPFPAEPNEKQIAESKIFISGPIEFIKDDPGRQTIGSFHPLTEDDWGVEAYLKKPQAHLCVAVACNDVTWIRQLLLLPGEDVNQRDCLGRTPLQVAVLNGHVEAVRILLECGAKCTARIRDGKMVTHMAATFGFDEILKLLLEKSEENRRAAEERERAKVVQETTNVDEEAIGGEIEIIEKDEVDEEWDEEEGAKDKRAKKENEDIDQELPNDIIDINIPDWDFDMTALEYAIFFGQVNTVKCLVRAGADIKLKKGGIPLLARCLQVEDVNKGLDIAAFLIENGATASQSQRKRGPSIFITAVKVGRPEFVKLFLETDPKCAPLVNRLDADGSYPLSIAVQNNRIEVFKLLAKYGAKPDVTVADYETYCQTYGVTDKPADLFKDYTQAALLDSEFVFTRMIAEMGGNLNVYSQPTACRPGRTLLDNILEIVTACEDIESTKPSEADEFNMLLKQELARHEPGSYKYFTYQLYGLKTNPPKYGSKYKELCKRQKRLVRIVEVMNLLLNKGAKLWKELEPEEWEKNKVTYNSAVTLTYPSSKPELLILPNIAEYSALSHEDQNASQPIPKTLWPLYTELFEAVWSNDLATVENLTLPTPNKRVPFLLLIAVQNPKGFTPFTLACYRGHAALAKRVLEIANLQYQFKEKEVEFEEGAVAESKEDEDENHTAPHKLHQFDSRIPPLRLLLQKARINFKLVNILPENPVKLTNLPLEEANKQQKSVDTDIIEVSGMDIAVVKNRIDVVRAILDSVPSLTGYPDDFSLSTVVHEREPNYTEPWNVPVTWAASLGRTEIIRLFIEYCAAGSNLSSLEMDDTHPHILQSSKSKYYLGLTINGYKKEKCAIRHNHFTGETTEVPMLHIAAYAGCVKSIKWLLSDMPTAALQRFAYKSSTDRRMIFLRDSKEIHKVGCRTFGVDFYKGRSPFFWAVYMNRPEAITAIANHYVPEHHEAPTLVDIVNRRHFYLENEPSFGINPLHLAASMGYPDCVAALIKAGADPLAQDEERGWNVLHHAVYQNRVKTVDRLFKILDREIIEKLLATISKTYHHTPLAVAVLSKHLGMVRLLISKASDVLKLLLFYDHQHNRPLHLAAKHSLVGCIRELVESEAKARKAVGGDTANARVLDMENGMGLVPYDIAVQLYITNGFNNVAIYQPTEKVEEEVVEEKLMAYISEKPDVVEAFKVLEGFVDRSQPRRIPVAFKDALKTIEIEAQEKKAWDWWSAEYYDSPDEHRKMILLN